MKVSSTKVPNLVRAVKTDIYYARIRANGKLRWRSLKTKTFTVAKLRLKDVEAEFKRGISGGANTLDANITFDGAFKFYEAAVKENPNITDSTKKFRLRSERTLRRTWPGLWGRELRRIKEADCQRWYTDFRNGGAAFFPNQATKVRRGDSPTTVNAAIRFLREVFRVGVDTGILYVNPAMSLETVPPRRKLLQLPNRSQFGDLIKQVRRTHSRWGQHLGDLVEGLAYTGARVGESRKLIWAHVDEERGMLTVPGEKTESAPRVIPMTAAFQDLVHRMKARKNPKSVDPLFGVGTVLESLKHACALLGIPKIDHHDLRHLFATTCIESGVDILTLSKWLGHADGGALVLKTYGHLRPEHSTRAARLVDFKAPERTKPPG